MVDKERFDVENIQYWEYDEKHKQTSRENGKTTDVDEASFCEDVAISLVLVVRVWVVHVVILFHVLRKQQQSRRG